MQQRKIRESKSCLEMATSTMRFETSTITTATLCNVIATIVIANCDQCLRPSIRNMMQLALQTEQQKLHRQADASRAVRWCGHQHIDRSKSPHPKTGRSSVDLPVRKASKRLERGVASNRDLIIFRHYMYVTTRLQQFRQVNHYKWDYKIKPNTTLTFILPQSSLNWHVSKIQHSVQPYNTKGAPAFKLHLSLGLLHPHYYLY